MSGLSEREREALDEALWGGRIYDDVPAVVERIIDERDAAIRAEAKAEALAPIRALADEWDRETDAVAITYQNPLHRTRATASGRRIVRQLRALLDDGDQ